VLIVVHELLHAVVQPDNGLSNRTIFGLWVKYFVFYTHFSHERTKNNFLIGLIFPFLVLSVIPSILLAGLESTYWWLAAAIILNAFFSSVDIFGFLLIAIFVPSKSIVRNNGWDTYWKKHITKQVEEMP
jgi:Putative zincin peptidase